jgi:hypothetical protein
MIDEESWIIGAVILLSIATNTARRTTPPPGRASTEGLVQPIV